MVSLEQMLRNQSLIFVSQEARQVDRNIASSASEMIFKEMGILQPRIRELRLLSGRRLPGTSGILTAQFLETGIKQVVRRWCRGAGFRANRKDDAQRKGYPSRRTVTVVVL